MDSGYQLAVSLSVGLVARGGLGDVVRGLRPMNLAGLAGCTA